MIMSIDDCINKLEYGLNRFDRIENNRPETGLECTEGRSAIKQALLFLKEQKRCDKGLIVSVDEGHYELYSKEVEDYY